MKSYLKWLSIFTVTGFFTGFLPGKITGKRGSGGGLAGSIVALSIQVWLLWSGLSWKHDLSLAVLFLIIGLLLVGKTEVFMLEQWGTRKRHSGESVTYDFNETNIDEISGQFFAGLSAFLVDTTLPIKLIILLISFFLFRYFDVKKPLGIKHVENGFKGKNTAFPVMLDDTLAGIYALVISYLVAFLLP